MNKIVLFAMLLLSLSCSAESVVVTDDLGNRVSMASPPVRIVSLAPHLTEILFSLGVGDRLIATVRYSDYPEAAKQVPRLGDAFSLSIEAIVGVNPDLILAWSTGGNQRTLTQLRELGFAIYLNESADLQGIASTVRRIGKLVGKPALANRLAGNFADELSELRMQQLAGPAPGVFFQISDSQLYTINSQHLIGQGIELCGGINVFGDLPIMVPLVSLESVIDANPDVILVASPHEAFVSRWTKEWARLKWDGRVRTINASLITRPSLRMLDGIKSMCKLMNE
jgi:iron complex transport system substrate-binding protein